MKKLRGKAAVNLHINSKVTIHGIKYEVVEIDYLRAVAKLKKVNKRKEFNNG